MALVTVLADDLTGALDTAVKLVGEERTGCVGWREDLPARPVLALDTETRDLSPAAAAARVACWARLTSGLVYKKMDSTLRGPFASEAVALVGALGLRGALVCPAFPAVGRTVKDGRLLVRGRPLAAAVPESGLPLPGGDLADILKRESALPPGHLTLARVRQGPEALSAVLRASSGTLIADAETEDDLLSLALAVIEAGDWLPVGSAGLAGALAQALGWRGAGERAMTRPELVVCGSASPVSRRQVAHLAELLQAPVVGAGQNGAKAVIETSWQRHGLVILAMPGEQCAEPQAHERLQGLAELAANAVRGLGLTRLFVTGGETLLAVAERLGVAWLEPLCEPRPGVVLSRARLASGAVLEVVSKAGGFGEADLLQSLWAPGDRSPEQVRGTSE